MLGYLIKDTTVEERKKIDVYKRQVVDRRLYLMEFTTHMEKLLLNYIFSLTIPGLLGKYK